MKGQKAVLWKKLYLPLHLQHCSTGNNKKDSAATQTNKQTKPQSNFHSVMDTFKCTISAQCRGCNHRPGVPSCWDGTADTRGANWSCQETGACPLQGGFWYKAPGTAKALILQSTLSPRCQPNWTEGASYQVYNGSSLAISKGFSWLKELQSQSDNAQIH